MLLISNNLPCSEIIAAAVLPNVVVVPVQYEIWSLDDLRAAIKEAAQGRTFTTIGLFDHGRSGEFCLLKSVGGGAIDLEVLDHEGARPPSSVSPAARAYAPF